MKNNIDIALDVDDVLAAFYPAMCKKFNRPEVKTNIWDGKKSCKWIADSFPAMWEDKEFWANMNMLSYPQSITFDFKCYLTAIADSLCGVRREWLSKNGFPDKPVICTTSKHKVDIMRDLDIDVLIDDKPSTIKSVRDAGLIGIQFIPHYMSNFDPEDPFSVRHLSEINEIIEKQTNLKLII